MKNVIINVFAFSAGILLWLASFVLDVPKYVEEPAIECVALDKKNIANMQAIEVEHALVIGK